MEKLSLRYALYVSFFVLLLTGAAMAGTNKVSPAELKAMLANKEPVVLIDVRTPEEYAEAHIPGSILLPLDTLERVRELPKGGRLILYCRSGKRSARALEILSAKGFTGLSDLEGGIKAWVESGGTVVSGPAN